MMKKLLLISHISFFSSPFCFSQNLVPNPSFEQFDTCPDFYGQINHAIPWYNPTTGSPDYFACSMVPFTGLGIQNSYHGNSYAGFFAYYDLPDYREYLEVQLQNSLIAGTKYFVSFYVSLADSVVYGTDAIEVFFSPTSVIAGNYNNISLSPQFSNTTGNFITDKNNWIQIKGSFFASGGESFMIIGNFKNNTNTSKIYVGGGSTNLGQDSAGAYYYIDAVCIADDSTVCESMIGINESSFQKQVKLFPNPTTDILNIHSDLIINRIKIINDKGQIITTKYPKISSIQIDVSTLQAGLYFIIIESDENIFTKKFLNINQ